MHTIKTFISFKITFNNIRSQGAPFLVSRGLRLQSPPSPPGFSLRSQTWGLIALSNIGTKVWVEVEIEPGNKQTIFRYLIFELFTIVLYLFEVVYSFVCVETDRRTAQARYKVPDASSTICALCSSSAAQSWNKISK